MVAASLARLTTGDMTGDSHLRGDPGSSLKQQDVQQDQPKEVGAG